VSSRPIVVAALSLAVLVGVPCTLAAASPVAIAIPEWLVVGPFETGSREGLVHHLADRDGGVPRAFPPDGTWPSVLADGGRVGWKRVAAERDEHGALSGLTKLKFEGVNWDVLEGEWGGAVLLNTAYASASFVLAEETSLLLEASRCVVVLNGIAIAGDPYGAGIAQSIVRGRIGTNDLLVISSGFGGERAFELKLIGVPPGELLRINEKDLLIPDVVAGLPGAGFAGVPVVSASDAWLPDLEVVIEGALTGSARIDGAVAPRAALKVPVAVAWAAPAAATGDAPSAAFTIRVRQGSRVLATAVANAWIRVPGEARVETFASGIDGSAQKYAILPATGAGADPKALILSLHGAGVDCLGQARAYSPKAWAHVVAPTNRRPFGFDWHDWGALDAEEVMREATSRLLIDLDRVHLSGHSMGGHGAWSFGATHPGTFATVAPSAGWNGYDTYMPTTLRRSVNFAPAEVAGMYPRAIAPGRASTLLGNLVNTQAFVLHGGADDNVPPTHGRLLAGELERLGADVTYREVPGQGHWWDLDKDRPGADCLDSAELEAFWKVHVRERWPRRVVFETADPDLGGTSHWVIVEQQQRVAESSRVEVEAIVDERSATPPRVVASTRNVAMLSLHLAPRLVPEGDASVEIDGQILPVQLGKDREIVRLVRDPAAPARWKASVGPWIAAPASPGLRPGSFKKAMYEPFTIVVGTQAKPERNEVMLDLARSIALAWWVRANGTCPIMRDVDVTDTLRASRNLVLLGGPDVNAETKRAEKALAIVATSRAVTLAGRRVPGDDLACVHWQPSPTHPARRLLVFQATTPMADALLGSFNPVGSGQGWPDFVVATPAIRLRSWGGFAAAGWWDPKFAFDPRNAWLATESRED
jgi:dienelactone hydrolase